MYSSWVISQPTKSTVVDTGIRLGRFPQASVWCFCGFFSRQSRPKRGHLEQQHGTTGRNDPNSPQWLEGLPRQVGPSWDRYLYWNYSPQVSAASNHRKLSQPTARRGRSLSYNIIYLQFSPNCLAIFEQYRHISVFFLTFSSWRDSPWPFHFRPYPALPSPTQLHRRRWIGHLWRQPWRLGTVAFLKPWQKYWIWT